MANKIILKRGADGNVSSLTPNSVGEPIWGTTSNKLYVASGTSAGNFEWVGASILDEDAMGSDSNTKLATQQSIKAYVDAQDANIASDTLTFTNKTFDANGTGNALSNVDVADFASGVFKDEDGMDSDSATAIASQQSIKAYVDAQVTAQDLDFQGDSGGALAIDLDSEALTIAGGEGIDTSGSGNTLTIAGEDASTSNKGIASFASADFSVSSGAVSIASIGNSQIDNSSISVTDGSTASDVDLGGTLTFSAVANETTVAQSGGTVTIGLPDDVTIGGNLTVNGEMTSTTSSSVAIGDVNVKLAQTNTANSVDIGIYGRYRTASTDLYKGVFSDQDNADVFTFFKGSQTEPTTTVNTGATGYALAGIKCASVDGATLDGGSF